MEEVKVEQVEVELEQVEEQVEVEQVEVEQVEVEQVEVELEPIPKEELEFDYSKALRLLKEGKKVSTKRWGDDGKVYVDLVETQSGPRKALVKHKQLFITDTNRRVTTPFVPNTENQISDVWYEVK